MENEQFRICIGDYVRVNGRIGRVLGIKKEIEKLSLEDDTDIDLEANDTIYIDNLYNGENEEYSYSDIEMADPVLINVIEPKDYVNGLYVSRIEVSYIIYPDGPSIPIKTAICPTEGLGYIGYKNSEIKTVVTHEYFEKGMYICDDGKQVD